MSKHTTTVLRDDLDGSLGATTYRFGVGEEMYEVDLSPVNAARFRQTMGGVENRLRKYMEAGRSVGTPQVARTRTASNLIEVRQWARTNGYKVGNVGRVSKVIMEAYAAAHPTN